MTTFYQGPSLLTNALVLAIVGAFLIPFLYEQTGSMLTAIALFLFLACIYSLVILLRGVPRWRKKDEQ